MYKYSPIRYSEKPLPGIQRLFVNTPISQSIICPCEKEGRVFSGICCGRGEHILEYAEKEKETVLDTHEETCPGELIVGDTVRVVGQSNRAHTFYWF